MVAGQKPGGCHLKPSCKNLMRIMSYMWWANTHHYLQKQHFSHNKG